MFIDTHMHINSNLINNIDEYISKINSNNNLLRAINVGLNVTTSIESVAISQKNEKIYSSIGIHPLYINGQNCDELYKLVTDKVLAIGEIGLDSTSTDYINQKKYLIRQIYIANELNLPIIIHSNNTNKEVIDIFEKCVKPQYGCVFHCFQPDFDSLKYLITNGYYISFAGRITYKTAKLSIEIAKTVPNDLFLVETDSPYISPEPVRYSINESANIGYIIQKLSEIKNLNYSDLEIITSANAKKLFRKMK